MKEKSEVKIRGLYGKPMHVHLSLALLDEAAQIILDCIHDEIRKDIAKAHALGRVKGQPARLPDSEEFVKSFTYRIRGNSTVEIVSTWPTALAHTEKGHDKPRKMSWLVRSNVPTVPMVTTSGEVIFRTTPMNLTDAWIHPGFARYTFIERGARKGREQIIERMGGKIIQQVMDQGLFGI